VRTVKVHVDLTHTAGSTGTELSSLIAPVGPSGAKMSSAASGGMRTVVRGAASSIATHNDNGLAVGNTPFLILAANCDHQP